MISTQHSAMTLADASIRPPVAVARGTSLADAARTMRDERVSSIVVGERGQLISIVTERDLVTALADGRSSPDEPVDAVAVPNPITADLETPVHLAARDMLRHGIRHLVVTSGRQAAGVVSIRELLACLLASDRPDLVLAVVRDVLTERSENWLG
jgi:CBS domain-containing protein